MLEDKIRYECMNRGSVAKSVGIYALGVALVSGVLGCDTFKYEHCSKATTLTCSDGQYPSCTKPVGAPEKECGCTCPPKEPIDHGQ